MAEYSYQKDGQQKVMLRCSDAAARQQKKHKEAVYFQTERGFWSPKFGNLPKRDEMLLNNDKRRLIRVNSMNSDTKLENGRNIVQNWLESPLSIKLISVIRSEERGILHKVATELQPDRSSKISTICFASIDPLARYLEDLCQRANELDGTLIAFEGLETWRLEEEIANPLSRLMHFGIKYGIRIAIFD